VLLGLPKFMAPRSYHIAQTSLQTLVSAFTSYLDHGGADQAASFIQDLCNLATSKGLDNENVARALVGSILAIVNNTIPTTFWVLAHVFSSPALLEKIRLELAPVIVYSKDDEKGNLKEMELDVSAIQSKCPLLVSTYQETLRLTTGIASIRFTIADTLLSDRYLLKKNTLIQMPTAFIHSDPSSWGPDAASFRPGRFLKSQQTKEEHALRTIGFRPFGGGAALCPGRHLAFSEIITFVGIVFMAFDIAPVDVSPGAAWKLPEKDKSKMPMSSLKPVGDVQVVLSRRSGFENVRFR
jgi:cytochrome P450